MYLPPHPFNQFSTQQDPAALQLSPSPVRQMPTHLGSFFLHKKNGLLIPNPSTKLRCWYDEYQPSSKPQHLSPHVARHRRGWSLILRNCNTEENWAKPKAGLRMWIMIPTFSLASCKFSTKAACCNTERPCPARDVTKIQRTKMRQLNTLILPKAQGTVTSPHQQCQPLPSWISNSRTIFSPQLSAGSRWGWSCVWADSSWQHRWPFIT